MHNPYGVYSDITIINRHAWQHVASWQHNGSKLAAQWQHGSIASAMHQNDAEMHHNGAKCTKTMLLNWHRYCSMRMTINVVCVVTC